VQTRGAHAEPAVAEAAHRFDLDAYFSRIGYGGSRAPTLATLRALHALHPAAIAFENLDVLLARRIRLDSLSLERKLVEDKRGGYCFEQNGLLALALEALGFKVTGLAARVYIKQEPGKIRRSHMLLKVDLSEGPHIADVGFGVWAMSGPLRLFDEGEQDTPHGLFRLVRAGDWFDVQTVLDGSWTTLYRFTLEEQLPTDYEVANWYCSTHPDSGFLRDLMVARLPRDRRLGMLNNRLSIHYPDGRAERRELESAAAIADVLENEFAIALPEPREELMAALAKLVR
jgi:N-hydroxyarylamine O-acetyltransferase